MKRYLRNIALFVMVCATLLSNASPESVPVDSANKGVTNTVLARIDSLQGKDAAIVLASFVREILNDTLVKGVIQDMADEEKSKQNNFYRVESDRILYDFYMKRARLEQGTVITAICVAIPAIVLLITVMLILNSRNRNNRRRFETIDRAIAANYPLDAQIFNENFAKNRFQSDISQADSEKSDSKIMDFVSSVFGASQDTPYSYADNQEYRTIRAAYMEKMQKDAIQIVVGFVLFLCFSNIFIISAIFVIIGLIGVIRMIFHYIEKRDFDKMYLVTSIRNTPQQPQTQNDMAKSHHADNQVSMPQPPAMPDDKPEN